MSIVVCQELLDISHVKVWKRKIARRKGYEKN